MKRVALLALLLALTAGACARQTLEPAPPPRLAVELPPPSPGADYRWLPGHWEWTGRRYAWIPGRWVEAPPGAQWQDGSWMKRPRGWIWLPGHWR
jgi:hypothetical protein